MMSTGALLCLLLWLNGLVLGEISENFSKCLKFFYNNTPPTGIDEQGYKPICQRYKNKYHFATLYDCKRRIPLYSAYMLTSVPVGQRPRTQWMYEPQLAFPCASPEMKPFEAQVDENVINSQAVLEDYKNSKFTKGHLNPSMHQKTNENRVATFTLTNIVPQREGSNCGPWCRLEKEVLENFKKYCKGTMHVITGSMPYACNEQRLKNRVSVPEYMWSAYCCPSYSDDIPESLSTYFPTYAAVGRNDPNSSGEIVPIDVNVKDSERGYDVRRMPVKELEAILEKRLGMCIQQFDGQCQKKKIEIMHFSVSDTPSYTSKPKLSLS